MRIQSVTLSIIFVLLGLLASQAADGAPKTDPKGEQFKREMLPKVGQNE